MSLRILQLVLALLLCSAALPHTYAQSATDKDDIVALAKGLAERIVASTEQRPRVTVLDFTDIQNRPNELGRYLALELANELVMLREVAVLDRANLETIMAEHQLTAEGLLRPEDAKKLGQFAGVDAIMIGNLSLIGDNFELFVRSISTESSEIVASGKAILTATEYFRQMYNMRVQGHSQGASSNTGASATEGEAVATRDIGPIIAVLRNAVPYMTRVGNDTSPALRCTFDLENPNLQRWAAIAATQRVTGRNNRLEILGYRSALVDSNRVAWGLSEVQGISALACFDASGTGSTSWRVEQRDPGGATTYIRNGRRYDGGSFHYQQGRFWTGSFAPIPPGEKIRVTLDFVPSDLLDQRSRRSRDQAPWEMPKHVQFDIELVLATYAEGEDPSKATDLVLRNLTIDRVTLPQGELASPR